MALPQHSYTESDLIQTSGSYMALENMTSEPDAHILLTRFNLPSRGFESVVRSSAGWLEERVWLFERFCLPSVKAQTEQNFSWIIYFDTQSPPWLMGKIEQWQALPQLNAIFRDEVMLDDMKSDFERVLGYCPVRLTTTNLDNDDAIGRTFLSRLKAMAPQKGRVALFLSRGLVLSGDRLFLNTDPDNAFCSVSEDFQGFVTCWVQAHNKLSRSMSARYAGGQPGWLQVIHDNNVSNRARGRRVSPEAFTYEFASLYTLPAANKADKLIDLFWFLPQRQLREAGRALAKRIVTAIFPKGGIDWLKRVKHAVWQMLRRFSTMLPGDRKG